MISKGCIYDQFRVKDSCFETLMLVSSLIVNELEIFLEDILIFPPVREIDFGVDLLQNT